MQVKTIYIAEHEHMFAYCLAKCFELETNLEVIGSSSNGATAFNEIKEKKPDLLITEINIEALSGINLIRKIQAADLQTKVILLSSDITPPVIHKALSAGVNGILLKSDQFSLLTEAISVIHKRKFLSPGISDPLVNNFLSINSDPNSQKISPLSDREEQVAKLIGDGGSSKEIGLLLSISEKTVSKHRSNIFKKLNIKNTAQLVRYVYDNDLIG